MNGLRPPLIAPPAFAGRASDSESDTDTRRKTGPCEYHYCLCSIPLSSKRSLSHCFSKNIAGRSFQRKYDDAFIQLRRKFALSDWDVAPLQADSSKIYLDLQRVRSGTAQCRTNYSGLFDCRMGSAGLFPFFIGIRLYCRCFYRYMCTGHNRTDTSLFSI